MSLIRVLSLIFTYLQSNAEVNNIGQAIAAFLLTL